jgi:hypothetical protein
MVKPTVRSVFLFTKKRMSYPYLSAWQQAKPVGSLGIWAALNAVDIAISYAAISRGAMEAGTLYQITGSFASMSAWKMALVLLAGVLLLRLEWGRLLRVLNFAMLVICIYGVCVLLLQCWMNTAF